MHNGENRTHIISDLISSLAETESVPADDTQDNIQGTIIVDDEFDDFNNAFNNLNIY